MGKKKKEFKRYSSDFETSVYVGQENTEVWAAARVPIGYQYGKDDVMLYDSIDSFMNALLKEKANTVDYFHNLKFDGTFIIDWLKKTNKTDVVFMGADGKGYKPKKLKFSGYMYNISDKGQWYTITICCDKYIHEIRDSLKLLPFSVKKLGDDFKTEHRKTSIDYIGERHKGYKLTEEEADYIKNDVLVVKEALEIMFAEGHDDLTIGSCCLKEWKNTLVTDGICMDDDDYQRMFPNLYNDEIDKEIYGAETSGEYIRNAYKGGWCYVVPEKANKKYGSYNSPTIGTTADVNSLYPSVMHSESGSIYPYGFPHFFKGDVPERAKQKGCYYFLRIKTHFHLKEGKLPCIQIKGSAFYKGNEWLKTSYYEKDCVKYKKVKDFDGNLIDIKPTLTVTRTDWELIQEQYNLEDLEILDGCYFATISGIFDTYINYYSKIKKESKGAKRALAKLFLNNLYGKMSTSPLADFRKANLDENGIVQYDIVENIEGKRPGFIPIGAAITSYARNFTIRAAQKNYYGVRERGFIYADTDSIHCDLLPDEMKGIKVHPSNFNCWKLESCWNEGIFVRQKTYIERVTEEDREPIENPYYNVKAAGMPAKCQKLLSYSLTGKGKEISEEYLKDPNKYVLENNERFTDEELEFINQKRDITAFKKGLYIPGSLKARVITGGTILMEQPYKMS